MSLFLALKSSSGCVLPPDMLDIFTFRIAGSMGTKPMTSSKG